jgi:hypothetical protein
MLKRMATASPDLFYGAFPSNNALEDEIDAKQQSAARDVGAAVGVRVNRNAFFLSGSLHITGMAGTRSARPFTTQ